MADEPEEVDPSLKRTVVTEQQIRDAMAQLQARDDSRALQRVERLTAFYSQIPPALHHHELIIGIATIIELGEPVHPEVHQAMQQALADLLREHERASSLWKPGDPL